MQAIRQTQQLNKRELENATPSSASWHVDYRDTAWIYVGGLPFDLTEGDVVIIFSQFGNPTHLNLVRDKETGKSKGFGFLKYEDQRSCDLAVDNLTGAEVLGKLLRVDHTRYKKRDDEDDDTYRIDRLEAEAAAEQNGKRASDTEESDDEKRRRKRRKERVEDAKKLAIKEHGEDADEARARERHRERKHKHAHRDRDEERDKSRTRDEAESGRSERRRREVTERDRDNQDRKSKYRTHHRDSPSRERPSRNSRDEDDSGRRPGSRQDNRDYDERRHRQPRDGSLERNSRKSTDADEGVGKYRSARNGKTRRIE